MAKYFIEDTTLTAIADAVRAATGSTETIKFSEIPAIIMSLKKEVVVLEETTVEIVSMFGINTPGDLPAMDNFVIGQTYNITVSVCNDSGNSSEVESISVVAESETQLQFTISSFDPYWTYTITCGSTGSTIDHSGDETRTVTIKITT